MAAEDACDEKWFDERSRLLKALGHPVRLKIITHLSRVPACAAEINLAVDISQPNLSQHLKALRGAGLIDCACEGTKRCYYLCRPKFVADMLAALYPEHPKIILDCNSLKNHCE